MKYIFITLIINISTYCFADGPPESQIMDDYYYIYTGIQGEDKYWHELDTTVYNFTEDDYIVFPDYVDEERLGHDVLRLEGFDESEVRINKYPGYYNDTLQQQCVVLVTPKDYYASGAAWGIPTSVLLLYTLENNEWKLRYSSSFYSQVECIPGNEKSKINFLYCRIDYASMGNMQWLEAIYQFKANKPIELFNEISSDGSMWVYTSYEEDKSAFKKMHHTDDTLSAVSLFEEFNKVNKGRVEFKRAEDVTVLRRRVLGKPKYDRYIRYHIYEYVNGQLTLIETTVFRPLTEPY